MMVGGSRQETLDQGFVLLGTRQLGVPVNGNLDEKNVTSIIVMTLTTLLTGYKIHNLNFQLNKDIISYVTILLLLCCYANTDNTINTTNNEYQEKTLLNLTLLFNDSDQLNNKKLNDCSISLTEFIIYFYIQPIICFIGFILNILNVIIFCRPQFSGAAYAYMIAMSLADAITLISYMPSGLVR
ncbi:unnamed protein product [Schistosoma margrebowiei]|uniref:Uncharacterized protein n=1 Tax=Schistosoma margrebowiei TaxID=48269 RepID=A0A183N0D9_9TREM|nr:unnamed protein product [Schistosoma margrebowiei]